MKRTHGVATQARVGSFRPSDGDRICVGIIVPDHFHRRDHCPACGSGRLRTLFSRPYADSHLRRTLEGFYSESFAQDFDAMLGGATFVLEECTTCELVFQKEAPDAGLLHRLYTTWIDPVGARSAYERDYAAGRRLDLAQGIFVQAAMTGVRGHAMRSLDFGSGWGEWACVAQAFADTSCGTELSEERRAYASGLGVRMFAEEDLPRSYFHLINIEQVLEHLPDPRLVFARLADCLAERGVLHVAVPNGRRVRSKLSSFDREVIKPLGGAMHAVAPLQHLNCFNHRSLVALAEACGLVRVKPPWALLLRAAPLPFGSARQAIKSLARPFYLRSRSSTDLLFRRQDDPTQATDRTADA